MARSRLPVQIRKIPVHTPTVLRVAGVNGGGGGGNMTFQTTLRGLTWAYKWGEYQKAVWFMVLMSWYRCIEHKRTKLVSYSTYNFDLFRTSSFSIQNQEKSL